MNDSNIPSHTQILKSTTIIGGSSALNVVLRIMATKIIAILLGPTGVGLIGLYNAITGMGTTIAGMGLANSSGVRQVAEAVSSGNEIGIAKSVLVLRRISIILGIVGSCLFILFREPISILSFGNPDHATTLGLLSPVIGLTILSGAEMAFIRGTRRIGDLAQLNVLGVAFGTCLALPALYVWRQEGITRYLVITAVTTYIAAWWYARRIPITLVHLAWRDSWYEAWRMLGMGTAFMASSLATLATTYLIRVLVVRQMGLDAAGLYEAASVLANVYVGFILGAMGTDFFPHLTAIANDNEKSTSLINAQVEVGLLIAVPGIMFVLGLGPLILQLLYSPEFVGAFQILRWQAMGTLLRVLSWPLAYILLAKGDGRVFFGSELATTLFYLMVAWMGLNMFGLAGIGWAFFVMYSFYFILMFWLARKFICFHWEKSNLQLIARLGPTVLAAFLASVWLPPFVSMILVLALAIGIGIFSIRRLYQMVGSETLKMYLGQIRTRLGLKTRESRI